MDTIDAGQLRHRVTIQTQGPLDSHGQPNPEWNNLATVWARVKSVGGSKQPLQLPFNTSQGRAEFGPLESYSVTMRYYPGVDASCRLLFKGRVFDIASVSDREERNLVLDLVCHERLGVTS